MKNLEPGYIPAPEGAPVEAYWLTRHKERTNNFWMPIIYLTFLQIDKTREMWEADGFEFCTPGPINPCTSCGTSEPPSILNEAHEGMWVECARCSNYGYYAQDALGAVAKWNNSNPLRADGAKSETNGDQIECPYCGYIHEESFEFYPNELEYDCKPIDCSNCAKPMVVTREVAITYTAKPTEEK